MSKKQYNARLDQDAIEHLQAIASESGASVAGAIEALAYWLAGDDRALADCPLALREAIANRSGQGAIAQVVAAPPAPAPDVAALAAVVAALAAKVEALEKHDGAIAA